MKPSTYKLICGFTSRRVNILRSEVGLYQRELNSDVRQAMVAHYRRLRKINTRQELSEYIQGARTPVDL